MKRCTFLLSSWKSQWRDGEDGFAWKTRYLDEQRSRAQDFLFDVSKRQPIHDSIREYHKKTWNEHKPVDSLRDALSQYDSDLRDHKLRAGSLGDFYASQQDDGKQKSLPDTDPEDVLSKVVRAKETTERLRNDERSLFQTDNYAAEDIVDTLSYLSKDDLALLVEEFYPKTHRARQTESELMKDVMRTRKTMSPKHSYSKIPQQERTTWSPWYLRHLSKD
mmetsp:Transcript_21817/g.33903  ORF Transcript_21817/g.33903 Transcript_21817/m.33903 type:complete len:220 (-) Transcript_21817:44-703(-)